MNKGPQSPPIVTLTQTPETRLDSNESAAARSLNNELQSTPVVTPTQTPVTQLHSDESAVVKNETKEESTSAKSQSNTALNAPQSFFSSSNEKTNNKASSSTSYFSNHFRLRCLQALLITTAMTFTALAILISPSVAIIGAGLTAGLIAGLCYSALSTAFVATMSAAALEVSDRYSQYKQHSQSDHNLALTI